MAAGTYTGQFTIRDPNALNSPYEYNVNLLERTMAESNICGEVPIYAQNLVNPAMLVLLDVSSSMTSYMPVSASGTEPVTPDLSGIVQEIVNRSGWQSGNSMAFQISGASGERAMESYNGHHDLAPTLLVSYVAGGVDGNVEIQIHNSADDAEESTDTGHVDLTSGDLQLVDDGSENQLIGVRFRRVTIPQGAQITSAVIEFVKDRNSSDTVNLTIRGEAVDDAAVYRAVSADISSRTTTASSVPWNMTEPWTDPPREMRYVIGREVISELVEDTSISWGFGHWAFDGHPSPGGDPNLSLLPGNPYGEGNTDLYTIIEAGVQSRNATETQALKTIIEATTPTGGTPLGPSMLAAWQYFEGNIADRDGYAYDSSLTCQPKFLIDITDGQGYKPHTTVGIMEDYAELLADNEISQVAVGFGLDNATQLNEMARVANERGHDEAALFALHEEDANGVGLPFIAQNKDELVEALRTITSSVKDQIFIGSSPAPSTSIDMGTFVINAAFNAATWSGELSATPYDADTGELLMCVDSAGNASCTPPADPDNPQSGEIYGSCVPDENGACTTPNNLVAGECLCWTVTEVMPATKNAWTVHSDSGTSTSSLAAGEAGPYVAAAPGAGEIDLVGDNYICKPLGDIIKSTPVIVKPPSKPYTFDSYRSFKFGSAKNRDDMLYVGANDGALHAFNLQSGVEKWRFYPEALHQKIIDADICAEDYCHEYFVDGTAVVADVNVSSGSTPDWRTMIATGLGAGGDAYFALDITSAKPFSTTETNPLLATTYLWQFQDDELGLAMAKPSIARVNDTISTDKDSVWAAYLVSGYEANNLIAKEAYMYGFDAYTMANIWQDNSGSSINRIKLEVDDRISYNLLVTTDFSAGETVEGLDSGASAMIDTVLTATDELVLSSIRGTFRDGERLVVGTKERATLIGDLHSKFSSDALSDPLAVDIDFDQKADALYAGNLYGRIYRLQGLGRGETPTTEVLFDIDPTIIEQSTPFRSGISVGYDKDPNTIWVYSGTGKFEEQKDKVTDHQQYFVGLKDYLDSTETATTPVVDSNLSKLVKRQTVAVDVDFTGVNKEYRIMTNYTYAFELGTVTDPATGASTPAIAPSDGEKFIGMTSGAIGVVESVSTVDGVPVLTFIDLFDDNGNYVSGNRSQSVQGTFLIGEELATYVDAATTPVRKGIFLKSHPWYAKLQQAIGTPSERVVANSLVVGGVVFFTTFEPDDDVCGGNGQAWLYGLSYDTGMPLEQPVFDVSGDGQYDIGDTVSVTGGLAGGGSVGIPNPGDPDDPDDARHDPNAYPIAGIPLGRGIPSAPVLEGDMLFVNTTDKASPPIKVNLPQLKAHMSAWKDGRF
jgi:hypothetical protein